MTEPVVTTPSAGEHLETLVNNLCADVAMLRVAAAEKPLSISDDPTPLLDENAALKRRVTDLFCRNAELEIRLRLAQEALVCKACGGTHNDNGDETSLLAHVACLQKQVRAVAAAKFV